MAYLLPCSVICANDTNTIAEISDILSKSHVISLLRRKDIDFIVDVKIVLL